MTDRLAAQMQEYYRLRAPIYDQSMGYDGEEGVAWQRPVIDFLREALSGRTVLEVACGTGFWTQFVAPSARAVAATDFNETALAEARRKLSGMAHVMLCTADAYRLPAFDQAFDGGLAVDWFCHVPVPRREEFLDGLHARLASGARVILCDQLPKEAPVTFDAQGNHLQERRLPDGSRHVVIKNFPGEAEMRDLLAPRSREVAWLAFPEARRWAVSYLTP